MNTTMGSIFPRARIGNESGLLVLPRLVNPRRTLPAIDSLVNNISTFLSGKGILPNFPPLIV